MDRASSTATPVAWTIAGSDPGGGAGIQVDLQVMNAFGVHGCSVLTALTAQNTLGVAQTESVSQSMLRAQLELLAVDLPPLAIKTGMLGSASTCQILADFLDQECKGIPIVCDPVLRSTSGAPLLDAEALDLLKHGIFPHVAVLTPNLPEAGIFLGEPVGSIEAAADKMLDLGVASVLIKGGHADGNECRDYWTNGTHSFWMSSPRLETRATHGTGCILSSAIASAIARGKDMPSAVVDAKTFLNQCLRSPANLGQGHGPMRILPFEYAERDRPAVQ